MSVPRRLLACASALVVLAVPFATGTIPAASADTTTIDFNSFTVGSPNGQAGWVALGALDHKIVDNSVLGAPAAFGAKSLRISNAVTTSSFVDHTYSASLAEPAGEPTAEGGFFSGPATQSHFDAQWDFASITPNAAQVGLAVSASADRGDGARMSRIQMLDTPTGLAIKYFDYRDEHTVGGALGDANGCAANDDFFATTIVSDLDRTVAHTIRMSMDFLPGERNDVVRIFVDGVLKHVDTSWEDYFRYCEGNPTRTVDSILFRTGASDQAPPGSPDLTGLGFLIDNLTLTSGAIPTTDATGAWRLSPKNTVTSTSQTVTTVYHAVPKAPVVYGGEGSSYKAAGSGKKDDPKKDDDKKASKPPIVSLLFDLEASTRTVTEEKTSTGPVVFESDPTPPGVLYSLLAFDPSAPQDFADIETLVADYLFTQGNCAGGSLRWELSIDRDNDGTDDGNMFIYFGKPPSFTDCALAESQSGQNLIGSSDARYDMSQLGETMQGTYADALALLGTGKVTGVALVLDGGWTAAGPQRVTLSGAEVDGATWTPPAIGDSTTVISDVTTPFAPTCDLPPAKITWDKTVGGGASYGTSSDDKAPKADSGDFYRVVGCSYAYNLDAKRLDSNDKTRPGTYRAWVNIDGSQIDDPALFSVKAKGSGHSNHQ